MAKLKFNYQRRSKESVRERANMRAGGFDSIFKPQYKVYKIRDGKNLIRILPPTWEDADHYGFDIYVNYGIGVDEQSYLSLSKMLNKPDPLADARKAAQQEGDAKLEKALRPGQRIAMWVIDRQDEDEGPQIFNAPFTWDRAVLNISFDEDTKEVVYIDDPEQGCDLRFYKEGQGLKTKYDPSRMKLMSSGPVHEDAAVMNEWLEFIQANPIPDCLNFYDYEHIAQVFGGSVRTSSDDDDEPPPRKPTARAAPDPDPDDEPPPPAARRRAAPPPEEPDDDPEPPPQPPRGASIRERLRARTQGAVGRGNGEDD